MKYSPGRYVYGLAAIGSGICALVWHRFDALGNVPHREFLTYVAAAIEILGGIAVQWPRTARAGAVALGAIYLTFALLVYRSSLSIRSSTTTLATSSNNSH
jgi:uncharacterized membrane protein YphA (DoxX/SURF4 family)